MEIKAEHFADWSIDELTYTRDEAAEFCQLVKKRLGAPRLTRPFMLRSLVGIRKAKKRETGYYILLSAHLVCDISEFRRPLLVQKS